MIFSHNFKGLNEKVSRGPDPISLLTTIPQTPPSPVDQGNLTDPRRGLT